MAKIVTVQGQQKWECCLETRKTENSLLAEVNRLGQEGWEVLSVLYYKDIKAAMCWTAFLKRPTTGQAPPAATAEKAAVLQPAAKAEGPSAAAGGFDLSDEDFKLASE
jgi:hypothetical protein